ncbi:UNVERIFIED_CONTAM: hypothetical protein FKN15_055623 [Acipenser sinensis]
MKGRQKGKRKGGNKDRVFGCDLREHLNATGQEIPLVLRACSSFVEEHGVVDGIYRLSGVSSNTQKLRSKDIESGFNGTAAFMEVRIQSIVVEFILMHVEQLFNDASGDYHDHRPKSLPSPTFLPNQEEPYFRALPFNMPSAISPGDGPPQMRPYHAIIEVTDTKRKGSLKVKKWKSIFNLGRSNNSDKRKGKGEGKDKLKAHMRPAKSMDSLSSLPCTLEVNQRSSARTPIRHESFGPSEQQPSFLPPSPLTTHSLGGDSGAKGSQGYAVTYRRGGGASVSVVGGAVGGTEAGLGSSSLDNLSSNSPKGREGL